MSAWTRTHERAKLLAEPDSIDKQFWQLAGMPGPGMLEEWARRGWSIDIEVTKEVAAVADAIDLEADRIEAEANKSEAEADRIEAEHSHAVAPGIRQVFMSDALARQQLLDLIRNFLRWLPYGVKILPNVNYRQYRPFRREDP